MPSSLAIKEGGDPAGDPGYTAEVTRATVKRLSGEDSNPDVVPNKFGKEGNTQRAAIWPITLHTFKPSGLFFDRFLNPQFLFVYVSDVLGRHHCILGYKVAWLSPIRDWPVLALLTS